MECLSVYNARAARQGVFLKMEAKTGSGSTTLKPNSPQASFQPNSDEVAPGWVFAVKKPGSESRNFLQSWSPRRKDVRFILLRNLLSWGKTVIDCYGGTYCHGVILLRHDWNCSTFPLNGTVCMVPARVKARWSWQAITAQRLFRWAFSMRTPNEPYTCIRSFLDWWNARVFFRLQMTFCWNRQNSWFAWTMKRERNCISWFFSLDSDWWTLGFPDKSCTYCTHSEWLGTCAVAGSLLCL